MSTGQKIQNSPPRAASAAVDAVSGPGRSAAYFRPSSSKARAWRSLNGSYPASRARSARALDTLAPAAPPGRRGQGRLLVVVGLPGLARHRDRQVAPVNEPGQAVLDRPIPPSLWRPGSATRAESLLQATPLRLATCEREHQAVGVGQQGASTAVPRQADGWTDLTHSSPTARQPASAGSQASRCRSQTSRSPTTRFR